MRMKEHFQAAEERAVRRGAAVQSVREAYISSAADEMLTMPIKFISILSDLIESDAGILVAVSLRDAIEQSGSNWDGMTAFERLMRDKARAIAASDWDKIGTVMADDECNHADWQRREAREAALWD